MRRLSEEAELDYRAQMQLDKVAEARHAVEEQAAAEEKLRFERERQDILDIRRRKRTDQADSPLNSTMQVDLAARQLSNASNCQSGRFIGGLDAPLSIGEDLEDFNFDGATFRNVVFSKHSNLASATMIGADFENVTFERGCDARNVDFRQSHFANVTIMPGCVIQGASFQLARFDKKISVDFDHNNLTGASFVAPREDSWHSLSRSYSTIAQVLNAILSMTYFATILIKLYMFQALVMVQQSAFERMPSTALKVAEFSPVTVFEFVFGSQWTSFALAILIISYQALRLYLTVNIAPLIEAERQSGHTPLIDDFSGLLHFHFITKILGWITLVIFLYEIYVLINQETLLIPKSFLLFEQ